MDVKNTHSVTKTEISVFGRQALDAERRRSPSLADKVLISDTHTLVSHRIEILQLIVYVKYSRMLLRDPLKLRIKEETRVRREEAQ